VNAGSLWDRVRNRRAGAAGEASLLSLATQLEALFSFVTVVALTRTTTVSRAGEVFFAQALAAVIFLFTDPRLEDSLQRYAALLRERGNPGSARTLYVRCFQLDTAIALGSGAIVALILGAVQPGNHGVFNATFFALAITNATLQAPIGSATAGFAISGKLLDLGKWRIGIAVVSSAVNVIAIVTGGPAWYLALNAVTTGLATIALGIASSRLVAHRYGPAEPIPHGAVPGFVGFTVKSSLATSVAFASDQVLYTAAGAAGGATFLAQYRVATAPGRFVSAGASPVASVLFPRASSAAARGDSKEVRDLHERASRWMAPIALAITLSAFIAMPVVLPFLYGAKYKSVVVPCSIFVAAASVRAIVIWSKTILLAVGRPGLRLFELLLESIVMFGAVVWFAHSHALLALALVQLGLAAVVMTWWLALLRWPRLLVMPEPGPVAFATDDVRTA
jgi:O-antigen/teichoic acid export membrane protein